MHISTLPLIEYSTTSASRFAEVHKQLKMTCLLLQCIHNLFQTFLTILVCIGVIIASSCAYSVLKMLAVINFITCLCLGTLARLVMCCTIALSFTFLVNLPRENSAHFIRIWKSVWLSKEKIKILNGCKDCGFILGSYGITTVWYGNLGICI